MRKYLVMILDYLADEELHFWENCNCSDEIRETQDFDNCNCQENEKHIWRAGRMLDYFLNQPNTEIVFAEDCSAVDFAKGFNKLGELGND